MNNPYVNGFLDAFADWAVKCSQASPDKMTQVGKTKPAVGKTQQTVAAVPTLETSGKPNFGGLSKLLAGKQPARTSKITQQTAVV